jgi:hypothetical protein
MAMQLPHRTTWPAALSSTRKLPPHAGHPNSMAIDDAP